MATHQKLTASKRYLYKQVLEYRCLLNFILKENFQVEGGCWEINSIAERESQNHQRLPSKSIYFDQRENIYFCPKIAIGLPDEPIDLSTIHNKKQQEDLTISNSIVSGVALTLNINLTIFNTFRIHYSLYQKLITQMENRLVTVQENITNVKLYILKTMTYCW